MFVQTSNRSRDSSVVEHDEVAVCGPEPLCRILRTQREATAFFPRSDLDTGWRCGGLVAHRPKVILSTTRPGPGAARRSVRQIERILARRRSCGGSARTGVAVALSYDPFVAGRAQDAGAPTVLALEVNRSVRFDASGSVLLTVRGASPDAAAGDLDRVRRDLEAAARAPECSQGPARVAATPRTSLPREVYLRAVAALRSRISRGDIYQANLCQRITAPVSGDPFEWWCGLAHDAAAPRSAWFEAGGLALASISPELFLTADPDGNLSTLPIKGTRPRGVTPEEDRQAAEELSRSAKDRAELLMIVDLERNDLGRVCRVGSVHVPSTGDLQSFASVHHLVARVEGRLREGVGFAELIDATFPGGSITGAPKLAAMRILNELEPAARGFFTGCLFWAGDDGSLESSILIRTTVFADGRMYLGAGGGVVADSDPQDEWRESNHKARAAARALGFEPEEAVS